MLSAYIEHRIRRSPPEGACVVPGSTPVLAFGDARTAHVATLGLNPSRREFTDKAGVLLNGNERRLATHASLGFSDLTAAPDHVISQVLDECNKYFQRNHYSWFDRFDQILAAFDASYHDGSACHLDLVQWATDPVWGKLTKPIKNKLIADDIEFLFDQLQNENIKILLVNGSGVWNELKNAPRVEISEEHEDIIHGHSHQPCRLRAGWLFQRVWVVAWSANLQSSRGVAASLPAEIARRVIGIMDATT